MKAIDRLVGELAQHYQKEKGRVGARIPAEEDVTGPSKTISPQCGEVGVPGGLCPVGTSPGRETCISLLW